MRRAAKVDANQAEIVDAQRRAGASVGSLAAVGKGCPDLVVGYRGTNYLIEVKDGSKSPSERQLTADQVEWHMRWNGHVAIAHSVDEALQIIGVQRQEKP